MNKKERKEYKKLLKEYHSVHDYEYDEEDENKKEFHDGCRDTYDNSFISNDWNFGTDFEDF